MRYHEAPVLKENTQRANCGMQRTIALKNRHCHYQASTTSFYRTAPGPGDGTTLIDVHIGWSELLCAPGEVEPLVIYAHIQRWCAAPCRCHCWLATGPLACRHRLRRVCSSSEGAQLRNCRGCCRLLRAGDRRWWQRPAPALLQRRWPRHAARPLRKECNRT